MCHCNPQLRTPYCSSEECQTALKHRKIFSSLPNGWVSHKQRIIELFGIENLVQVKEKFGALRVYLNPANEYADEAKTELDAIAHKCSRTCMNCGSTERVYKRMFMWIGPICEECILKDAQKN